MAVKFQQNKQPKHKNIVRKYQLHAAETYYNKRQFSYV